METAINAKEIVINFNKAVDAATVIANDGTLVDGVFGITRTPAGASETPAAPNKDVVADTAAGTLSADGKSLTIRATGATYFDGTYAVTVAKNLVETPKDELFPAFATAITVSDNVRPTLVGVTYVDGVTAKVTFSEPIKDLGSVSFKRADGTALNAATVLSLTNANLSADGKSATLDLSGVNAADREKDLQVTLVGATDFAGNLISPNPVTATFKYSTSDQTAPTLTTVTSARAGQMTLTFSEKVRKTGATGLVGTFAVNGGGAVSITTAGAGANATVDETGTIVTVTDAALVAGLNNITIAGFSDVATNAGTATTKVVNFTADTVDPKVVSTSVEKISGIEYLVVNFDEEVAQQNAVAIGGKVVKNFVETTSANFITTAAGNFTLHNAVNGKSKSVKLDITALTDGAYTVTLPAGFVKDLNGRNNEAKSVSFTRTTNVDVNKPVVNGIAKINNNTYTVTFNKQLDATTALTLSNYTIEGATVTGAIFTSNPAGGPSVVKLTLADNSFALDGLRQVDVKNVKSVDGVVMNPYTTSYNFTENVKPTVTSAAFIANDTIKVTFSEALAAGTLDKIEDSVAAPAVAGDFEVVVGTVSEAGALVTKDATDLSGKTYIITLSNPLTATEFGSTVTLKAGSALNVTDASGNALSFTSVTVTK